MFNFERLDAWKEALDLADMVYDLTRRFPADERYGLTGQMRRAAVSVASNVAEGCSRASRIDHARFVEMAAGSVFELVAQAAIARRQGMLDDDQYRALYELAATEGRILSGLRRSLVGKEADSGRGPRTPEAEPGQPSGPSTISSQPSTPHKESL